MSISRIIVLALIVALQACKPATQLKTIRHKDVGFTTLCEINLHKQDYINRTVHIHSKYKTDEMTYSYFEDYPSSNIECSKYSNNILELGYIQKMKDPTVVEFLNAGEETCIKKLSRSACVLKADVTYKAKIVDDDGDIYIHMDHVREYKYYTE